MARKTEEQTWLIARGRPLPPKPDFLDDREWDIINRRCAGQTFTAIAQDYGKTRERIRQIEAKSLRKLRSAATRGDYDRADIPCHYPELDTAAISSLTSSERFTAAADAQAASLKALWIAAGKRETQRRADMDDAPDLFPLDDWPLIKRWYDCALADYPFVPVTWDEAEEFRPQLNAFTKAFAQANQEREQAGRPPYDQPVIPFLFKMISMDGNPDEIMRRWRDNPPTEAQFWNPDE